MTPQEEIIQDLKVVEEKAAKAGENWIACIICTLIASIYAGHDEILAARCIEYVKKAKEI